MPRNERIMWVDKIIEQKNAEANSINNGDNSGSTYTESY